MRWATLAAANHRDTITTRKPTVFCEPDGWPLALRADRHTPGVLAKLPPRTPLLSPDAGPFGSVTLAAGFLPYQSEYESLHAMVIEELINEVFGYEDDLERVTGFNWFWKAAQFRVAARNRRLPLRLSYYVHRGIVNRASQSSILCNHRRKVYVCERFVSTIHEIARFVEQVIRDYFKIVLIIAVLSACPETSVQQYSSSESAY